MKNPAVLVGAALLSSLSSVAFAQATAPDAAATVAASPTVTLSDTGSPNTADAAPTKLKFVAVKPTDIMSSTLVGMDIYNNHDEKVGEIDDLVVENGKTVTGLVVGVGGFLGMGESYVVLDPATVVIKERDGKRRAAVNADKDTLKSAPKFQYSRKRS